MSRSSSFLLALLVAGSAIASPPLEERNSELLKQHAEIWELMGLSASAQEELNAIVVAINAGLYANQGPRQADFERATAKRRSDASLTYEEFVSGHKRRFALLEISEPTQTELLAALSFTWKALHDSEAPEEKREVAEKIRDLMKSMGGPPPCCDDSIFERAGMQRSGDSTGAGEDRR